MGVDEKRRGDTVNKIRSLKIALLIVILAEEIRNARNYKKAIGKKFVYPKKQDDGIRLIKRFKDFR